MIATRDALNAFLDLPQVAVPHAESGPLTGLTLGVKDIFDVAGYRTGCGNPQRRDEASPAEATAPAVKSLLDSGAAFIGKTQTDELAYSLMGLNAHFPAPVNPAAPDRVTGGSSSGSAAAVAGRLADIATASDTGGSVRAPASFCGLVGLRTTHGRIPLDGTMPLAPSLDTFGWFARDMDIYGKVAEVMLGEADRPPHTPAARLAPILSPHEVGERWLGEAETERGCKALHLPALDSLLLGQGEATEYARMAGRVASVLGEPKEASPLSHSVDDLYWAFRRIQGFEAWRAHGAWISAKDRGLGPGVRERFEYGATIDRATYDAETKRRAAFAWELAELLGDDGVLVLPTVPGAAPLKAASFEDQQAYREKALRLLCLSGLSGFPQITIPLGAVGGAPFGISLLGPKDSDLALVGMAGGILHASGKA